MGIRVSPHDAGDSGVCLYDRFGRRIDYLRLSVTDRCNLRCLYCMPSEGVPWVDRREVLSWEEMYRLCLLLAEAGLRKIRLTGGEPLVRSGAVPFLSRLSRLPGSPETAITTNATLLADYIDQIADIGITRLNVSLDTLQRSSYRRLTGRDLFDAAWAGIQLAERRGFALKLNVVVLAGINDGEIVDFVKLTRERDLMVRFIEAMPFAGLGGKPGDLIDGDTILNIIRERFPIEAEGLDGSGVAELYRVPGFQGGIGLIRSHARSFCGDCSRLRINAVGQLRTCLYAEPALDLRALLRTGSTDEYIRERIAEAVRKRHWNGHDAQAAGRRHEACSMSSIGG